MAEATAGIDTSVLDELIAIRRQQALLADFRARAEARRSEVEPVVYERVMRDYAARADALAERAAPLEAKARTEYRTLRAAVARVEQRRDAARLDRAEVVFRHEVGEIDDATLAARLEGPETVLRECEEELDACQALKARFLEAYPGIDEAVDTEVAEEAPVPDVTTASAERAGQDVESPPVVTTAAPSAGGPGADSVAAAGARPEGDVGTAGEAMPGPPSSPEAVAPAASVAEGAGARPEVVAATPEGGPEAEADVTRLVAVGDVPPRPTPVSEEAQAPLVVAPPVDTAADALAASPAVGPATMPATHGAEPTSAATATPAEPATAASPAVGARAEPARDAAAPRPDLSAALEEATFILPEAVLRLSGPNPLEFRLGALNYIGRADDNQIRLKSADVSRRHAVISVTERGFVLRDLQSQNGSYVNGHRVVEQLLVDGDVVRIGNIELTFLQMGGRSGARDETGAPAAARHP